MNSSRSKLVVIALAVLALVAMAWHFAGPRGALTSEAGSNPSASASSVLGTAATATDGDGGRTFPRAVRDPAKRAEMRTRLLQALAEAQREADEEKAHPPAPGEAPRGNRETNDLKEFGRFVSQAIKEDFLPMARACSKELGSRKPDAGGSTRVAFKLLGDKHIGGVVDEAHIDAEKSTLVDPLFETCLRESMYGVYFDPPPFGGMATLNFDIVLNDKGEIEEDDLDFQNIKDRRGETDH